MNFGNHNLFSQVISFLGLSAFSSQGKTFFFFFPPLSFQFCPHTMFILILWWPDHLIINAKDNYREMGKGS